MNLCVLLISTFLLFISASERAVPGIMLRASTSCTAMGPVKPGQTLSFIVDYSWSSADYGGHALRISITLPPSIEFLGSSPNSSTVSGGVLTCSLAPFTVPSSNDPFIQAPKGQGSGSLTINVRVKTNPPSQSQQCISGTLYDGTTATSTGTSCFSVHCDCFGVVSSVNLAGGTSKSSIVLDLGPIGVVPSGEINTCTSLVASRISQLTVSERQLMDGNACNMNVPQGTSINAFAQLGAQTSYAMAKSVGTLAYATVTTCNCPTGWVSNTSGIDGGVTLDGKCKQQIAKITLNPPPPNTQVGTWGFTIGNALFAWGTATNGGAPNCITTVATPKACKIK